MTLDEVIDMLIAHREKVGGHVPVKIPDTMGKEVKYYTEVGTAKLRTPNDRWIELAP
jgi:hypothetical protein